MVSTAEIVAAGIVMAPIVQSRVVPVQQHGSIDQHMTNRKNEQYIRTPYFLTLRDEQCEDVVIDHLEDQIAGKDGH